MFFFYMGVGKLKFIFSAISPLILKGLVPILQHMSWIFQNTPTFSLSDGFQKSYGHIFWDPTFFWLTLYIELNEYIIWKLRTTRAEVVNVEKTRRRKGLL